MGAEPQTVGENLPEPPAHLPGTRKRGSRTQGRPWWITSSKPLTCTSTDSHGHCYSLITPDRWLADFANLDMKPQVRPKILKDNAVRVLNLGGRKHEGHRRRRSTSSGPGGARVVLVGRVLASVT
jgi:hypothetical protein